MLGIAFLIWVTEIPAEMWLVLCGHVLLGLDMSWVGLSTLGSLSGLYLKVRLLLLVVLLVLNAFLRLLALKLLLFLVSVWLLRVGSDLQKARDLRQLW